MKIPSAFFEVRWQKVLWISCFSYVLYVGGCAHFRYARTETCNPLILTTCEPE